MQVRVVSLSDGTSAAIEVPMDAAGEPQFFGGRADAPAQKTVDKLDDLGRQAMRFAEEIYSGSQATIQKIKPKRVSLEFGVGIEASGGIPFIASGKANASLTVTLEWEP